LVSGFSLTEVLLAVGILAVGMLFIASAFPVSIYFTTMATERTIAPVVADEAFAKCKIYLNNFDISALNYNNHKILEGLLPNEYAYPSTPSTDPYSKKYWWSAIFRRVDVNDAQVTVFVSRKVGVAGRYYVGSDPNFDPNRPDAIGVGVSGVTGSYELTFIDPSTKPFINDGYTIVDNATGQIYRVLERYRTNDTVIKLDRVWRPDLTPSLVVSGAVWVVPPPVNGGRYPCIGVYQKTMRF
jgi:hypothetical protein